MHRCHSPTTVTSPSPTHTLLRRATSKTALGSSIIRKDGCIILTKKGKIVSVRQDTGSIRRDSSFSGFEDLKIRPNKPVSRSLSEINRIYSTKYPLNGVTLQTDAADELRKIESSNENCKTLTSTLVPVFNRVSASLTRIDSVDESENDNVIRREHLSIQRSNSLKRRNEANAQFSSHQRESTIPLLQEDDMGCSPSTLSQSSDNVFVESFKYSPVTNISSTLTVPMKSKRYLSKSANDLDEHDLDQPKQKLDTKLTKSNDIVFRVPLLRCPSVETLDTDMNLPRCSSDAVMVKKITTHSPLYVRRWLSNKSVDKVNKTKM